MSVAKYDAVPRVARGLSPTIAWLLRSGVPLGPLTLLTVPGRRRGRPRTVPVAVLERDGRRWPAAVFGEVGWVRALRTAGEGILCRGRRREFVAATGLDAEAAGRVLRDAMAPDSASRMVRVAFRRSPGLRPDAPLEVCAAAARRHPVFALRAAAHRLPSDESNTSGDTREATS